MNKGITGIIVFVINLEISNKKYRNNGTNQIGKGKKQAMQ